MTSKLIYKKIHFLFFQIMVQICVLDQNVQRKKLMLCSWNIF